MKVKLLLPPLIIVLCIAMMIWFVYPAYTNGVDGIKEQRAVLAVEQKKMAEAKEKADNVSRMVAQLENNKADQAIIMSFVPENAAEEEIIDNLNFIASNEDLLIMNLSVIPGPVVAPVEVAVNEAGVPIMSTDPMTVTVRPKNYDVALTVVGNYEKIKNVFEKIYKLGRFNAIESLDLKKQDTQIVTGKKVDSVDLLTANAKLKFNMLKKTSLTVDINNAAFNQTNFNLEVAKAIRDKKNVEVLKMSIDQMGRSNPFLP